MGILLRGPAGGHCLHAARLTSTHKAGESALSAH
jgi:hypothetical protein